MGFCCKTSAMDTYDAYVAEKKRRHGNADGSTNAWGRDQDSLVGFIEIVREDQPDGSVLAVETDAMTGREKNVRFT